MVLFDLMPWVAAWVAMSLLVLGLAAYRKHLDRMEDTDLHLGLMTPQQAQEKMVFNHRLQRAEFLGKSFTVLLILLSGFVAALWAYNLWIRVYLP